MPDTLGFAFVTFTVGFSLTNELGLVVILYKESKIGNYEFYLCKKFQIFGVTGPKRLL